MIYYIRDDEGRLVGFKYNNTKYYYIKNLQDDIIGIMDSSFNTIVSYEYDSWGKVISIKDNNGSIITDTSHIGIINPYRYRSYYYDNETGYYYLNSRYYNPEWGRFINIDRYLGINDDILSYNLYAYVSNNPINNVDEDGRFLKKIWKSVKKAAKKITSGAQKAYSKVTTTVKKVTKAIKKSFTLEAEAGLGFGINTKVANQGINIGYDKTIGYNIKDGQYRSTNIGGEINVASYSAGCNLNVRNYDDGIGNPAATIFELWDDENTIIDSTIGFKKNVTNNGSVSSEASTKSHFIGIDFGLFVFGGFRIKVGFNIGG